MPSDTVAPIPWRYQDSTVVRIWRWETEHFLATITAQPASFAWEVGDLIVPVDGEPRFLAEGQASSFAAAEADVRETIGKSYPVSLGYRAFAGALATTFTLASGARVDLGEFDGQRVAVTVGLPGGHTQTLVGHAQVVHYDLRVAPDARAPVLIRPARIAAIAREGGGGASAATTTHTGMGRVHRDRMRAGCSGQPGFLPDTVDHTGPPCPLHEHVAPRFAPPPR